MGASTTNWKEVSILKFCRRRKEGDSSDKSKSDAVFHFLKSYTTESAMNAILGCLLFTSEVVNEPENVGASTKNQHHHLVHSDLQLR